ncbi:hypothetical protein AMJ57_03050 [Parcubacteria bacterium SG8_24]|nr:MAG: hypothetical protein AMJ57_03050 [Parcubacteria bacterium SG8_24]
MPRKDLNENGPRAAATGPEDLPTPEEIEEELETIYGDEEEERPDMTRLDQARHSTVKKILIGLIVFFGVLAAISWLGFFFFSPTDDKFSGRGVELVIDGPAEITSGSSVAYRIRYRNGERVPLGTSSLEVRLPKDFTVLGTEPHSEKNVWQIGSLPPGKEGEIILQGVFLSPLGRELDMQAILTYRPADFNSEFQKVATRTVLIDDSVFEVEVKGPTKVLPGDKVAFDYVYRNTSDNSFIDLRLRPVFPEGFIPDEESLPEDDKGWVIELLDAQAENQVTVSGTFAADVSGALEIGAELGLLDENEEFMLQEGAGLTVDVLEGELVTALILNGKDEDQTINFGDTLRYAVTYRNTGNVSLGNVRLAVVFETVPETPPIIMWNDLKDGTEGVRDGNRIIWEKKQVRQLERIEEDDEGVIEFSVPIIAEPLPDQKIVEYEVSCHVEAFIESADGDIIERTTLTKPIVAKIGSDTSVAATVRYFDDNGLPIGSGPLPPKAGQATTYRVHWDIGNSLHELTDLKMSARLPSNVTWTGASNIDAGDLQFDAAAEKLIWTLNWLPLSITGLRLEFDLALTPTDDQVGKIPTLIDATIFEATDKVTGSGILLSVPPLTTSLDDDPLASGKGRVER